ncbi:reverse transcriptase [Tanacetum coccineum]
MSSLCYWKGMRKRVKQWIRECDVCHREKPDLNAYPGLLQPLPIPIRILSEISMDFMEGLPKSHGKTVIFVVVDRLSKYAHFMPLQHPFTAAQVAQVFLDNVYKLHGLPNTIVSDKDKTEVVNRCLECYLRCMSSEKLKEWTQWISMVMDRTMQAREKMVEMLKFHLKRAQDRMKRLACKHIKYRDFEEGVFGLCVIAALQKIDY